MSNVYYEVQAITKHIIVRRVKGGLCNSVETIAEFESDIKALNTANALAEAETQLAKPPLLVMKPNGDLWNSADHRWSDEPQAAK